MNKKPFLLTFTLMSLFSCSVKEDRRECPCVLDIITAADLPGEYLDVAGFDSKSDRVLFDRFKMGQLPSHYERLIKREEIAVVGVSSEREMSYCGSENIIMVEEGCQADSLFAGATLVDASGETASTKISLHKQFSTINVYEMSEREEAGDYRIEIQGDCAGFNITTLDAAEGRFHYVLDFDPSGSSFRVLRQKEGSDLSMTLVDKKSGEIHTSFSLKNIMSSSGYDFSATDLQDLDVGVDIINYSVSVTLKEWNGNAIVVEI